ncbi:(Fe-S)-binding protein [candidate division KSB1 bacterium]|nr:(Fe-S)-binding protein [candidate division KSB1 bacterium]
MPKVAHLGVKDGSIRQTVNGFWKELFEKKIIEGLMVPLELPNRASVVQTLVTEPGKLKYANAFAPVMPVNASRIVSRMTKVTPSQRNLAVVLRPCEMRALIDLTKLKQASLENILTISYDCFGAYSVTDYMEFAEGKDETGDAFIKNALEDKVEGQLRWNCTVCEHPVPLYCDLIIGFLGRDAKSELCVIAQTEAGENALKTLNLELGEIDEKGEQAVAAFVEKRTKDRDAKLEEARKAAAGPENMLNFLSTCIKCHNCMTNCPICYCKECFFNSPTFELDSEKYFDWADRRGGIRMPNDTLFFHLTRMAHMATSCVACGACTEACPSDIEIAKLFTVVGKNIQDVFKYIPGKSLDEPLPLADFKEEELRMFEN